VAPGVNLAIPFTVIYRLNRFVSLTFAKKKSDDHRSPGFISLFDTWVYTKKLGSHSVSGLQCQPGIADKEIDVPDTKIRAMTRWLPDYAIGVQEVDTEHQGLFSLAEKLHRGILSGDREIVGPLLLDLVDYTCYHFAHEEQLMQRIGYPHYADHCQEHQNLRSRAFAMKESFDAGQAEMAIELLQFVTDWLKCHTTTTDRRIGSYMRKHGLVS
jgi:hemerythrin